MIQSVEVVLFRGLTSVSFLHLALCAALSGFRQKYTAQQSTAPKSTIDTIGLGGEFCGQTAETLAGRTLEATFLVLLDLLRPLPLLFLQ